MVRRAVFINYRGADSHSYGALLYQDLTNHFGENLVFLDAESIPAGVDFAEELLGHVRSARVLLAVIGQHWLTATDPTTGRRRIDDPDDWIRRELTEAFAARVRVIPVLTDQAELPREADLPADIAALSRCQYRHLRRRETTADLARIVTDLIHFDPSLDADARRPVTETGAGRGSYVAGRRRSHVGTRVWRRRSAKQLAPPTSADIAAAEDALAGLVAEQWNIEAALRSLGDPDPISVRWRLVDRLSTISSVQPGNGVRIIFGSSGQIDEMAERFRALHRRRLVIVGGPGTGKTTLAVQLVRSLVASRRSGEPVPVLLSIAGWNTDAHPRLHDWLATRLRQDYPALCATELGDAAPHTLAARSRILPVLDGLDELPEPARPTVIAALTKSLGDDDQLILTSRSTEFAAALGQASTWFKSTAVIEPKPLPPDVIADYLQLCLPPRPDEAWEKILDHIRVRSGLATPLTEIAATPFGLWLLRSTYITAGADPTVLLRPDRFATAAELRGHLFDELIPTLVRSRPPSRDRVGPFRPRRLHDPAMVRKWLGFLAEHLNRIPNGSGGTGSRDFAWWQLARYTIGRRTLPRIAGPAAGLMFGLMDAVMDQRVFGVGVAIASWAVLGVVGGVMVGRTSRAWSTQAPGFAQLRLAGRVSRLAGLAGSNALVFGRALLAVGALFVIVTGSILLFFGRFISVPNLGRDLSLGQWVTIGLLEVLLWVSGGIVLGVAQGLAQWIETPTPAGRASTPLANWRADRILTLTRIGISGFMIGVLALVLWLAVGRTIGWSPGILAFGHLNLATWLPGWFVAGCVFGLAGGKHHAWIAYTFATGRLARRGRLPRDLMSFLDDAHRLGLLRAVGPIYQFRQAGLQDHFAGR